MQRTVNYDLCQYEGSDKTSYLINYNGDMLKIDTAIKGAKDAADNAQSKANTADGKADINASSISTLDTQINGASGLAADVTAVQGSVNTINSLIGSGEPTTQDKTIIGAINELAAEMPSPTTQLPASSVSYVNTTSGLTADNAQEAIDELKAEIDAIDPSADVTIVAEETKIGTFLGKDLYRKVVTDSNPTHAGIIDATLTSAYVDDLVNVGGYFVTSDGKFPAAWVNAGGTPAGLGVGVSSTGLQVFIQGITATAATIVIEYTKATV